MNFKNTFTGGCRTNLLARKGLFFFPSLFGATGAAHSIENTGICAAWLCSLGRAVFVLVIKGSAQSEGFVYWTLGKPSLGQTHPFSCRVHSATISALDFPATALHPRKIPE